jgi:phage major head subunit gpT-like protein
MGTTLSIAAGLQASNTTFQVGYEEYFGGKVLPGAHQYYVDEEPMTSETKRFDWVGKIPLMERWLGSRRVKSLRMFNQVIVAEPWVATMEVRRRQLMFADQLGVVARALKKFIAIQANVFDKDANTVLFSNSGAGPTGFDGVALFSASHPYGPAGATQSNLAAGVALSGPALDTAMTAMSGLRLENGEPAGINPDTLIVGPALRFRAMSLVGAMSDLRPIAVDAAGLESGTRVAVAASSNVYQGSLKVVVDMRRPATGTGAFYWELVDSTQPKALVRHVQRAPEPHHQDQMDSPARFEFDVFRYGMEGDWKTDAGFWPSIYRATGTA